MLKDTLRRYFIPDEHNNYAPHILQKTAISVMLFLVLVTFAVTNIQSIVLVSSKWFVSTILPSVLVDLTNESRDEERLDMLTRSTVLDRAAQLKAEDMARGSYFAHTSPAGVTPWHWFKEVNYTYAHAGENLAVHFTDSKEVVDAWMDSPGHRANILDGNYTEIGIGTAQGEYKGAPTVFVVQLFGRPAAVAAASTPTPAPTPAPIAVAPTPEPETISEPISEPETAVASATPDVATSTLLTVADDADDIEVQGVQDTEDVVEDDHEASTTDFVKADDRTFPSTASILRLEIATTSGLAPLATAGMTSFERSGDQKLAQMLGRFSTQPSRILTMMYTLLALFVVAALVTSIVIEWRRQHPLQIAYGTGLLALMTVMWYVQEALVSGALIT